jgi:membrane protein DedA with SNARE-associated domain
VEHALAQFLAKYTYLAMLVVLVAAGMGVPVSEDLTLLLAGALAGGGVTRFWPTAAGGYLGVLLGDLLIYNWGARLGPAAYNQPRVRKHLSPDRQQKLREHFARHGFLTVVVGRHTPMLRAPIFFLAGASGVPLWKFLLADGLSAAVTVPVITSLGYYFGDHLDEIRRKLHGFQWAAAALILVAVALYWYFRRRFQARMRAPQPGSVRDPSA